MSTADTGYGIDLSGIGRIKWNDNFKKKIYEMFPASIMQRYRDFTESLDKEDTDNMSKEEMLEQFIDSYENDTYMWNREEGLLCDIINESEFPGEQPVFRYEDGYLYVSADIPEDETEREHMLTKEQIRKIIAKYLNAIIPASPLTFEYVEIIDYGA